MAHPLRPTVTHVPIGDSVLRRRSSTGSEEGRDDEAIIELFNDAVVKRAGIPCHAELSFSNPLDPIKQKITSVWTSSDVSVDSVFATVSFLPRDSEPTYFRFEPEANLYSRLKIKVGDTPANTFISNALWRRVTPSAKMGIGTTESLSSSEIQFVSENGMITLSAASITIEDLCLLFRKANSCIAEYERLTDKEVREIVSSRLEKLTSEIFRINSITSKSFI